MLRNICGIKSVGCNSVTEILISINEKWSRKIFAQRSFLNWETESKFDLLSVYIKCLRSKIFKKRQNTVRSLCMGWFQTFYGKVHINTKSGQMSFKET